MSSQASVRSIDTLKDLRVALALYGEDTLGAIGAVEAEVRRTLRWLLEEQPVYWQNQIKRRREEVSSARAEVFKKNLQKRADYNPPMSEQKDNLRKAEANLQDAEKRLAAVKKWQPLFKGAVLEYHASVQRIKDIAAGDVPRAVNLLSRMVDSLEAYLRVTPPSGLETLPDRGPGGGTTMAIPTAQIDSVAVKALDEAEAAAALEAQAKAEARSATPAESPNDETNSSLERISHSNDEALDA
jgi:hypothetical protein